MHTSESCKRRSWPNDTCYEWPYLSSEQCALQSGCSFQPMCEAADCIPVDGYDASVNTRCKQEDHLTCAQLSEERCALNSVCTWSLGCGGVPDVDCSSFKTDVECMATSVCFWSVESG
jgi:hypothetical protein